VDALLRLVLTNAVLAGLLALAAWVASRFVRRQAVVHGLWLLALVKLVTPPLVGVPLLPAGQARTAPPTGLESPGRAHLSAAGRTAERRAEVAPTAGRTRLRRLDSGAGTSALNGHGPWVPAAEATAPPGALPWRRIVAAVLALGSVAVFGLTAWRFFRFRSLLSRAEPAPPELVARAARLAERLGVSRVPPLLLVPARVSPMLWTAPSGPRLLLPLGLLPELDDEELDALLAHELAHVRRRDHWVRFLEIGATTLFWWYPVTWWARRALRRAEERCCDEWVLLARPESARAYAGGILKCLAFLSGSPSPLPAAASGAAPVEELEDRLKEILMTPPLPRLSRPVRLAFGATAILGLALFPTVAPPRTAEAAAAIPLPGADSETPRPSLAPPAPRAPRSSSPAPAPAAPEALEAPLPAPDAVPMPRVALAPLAAPAPLPEADEPDPAILAEHRAIEEQRRQLRLSELDLERRALDLEARQQQGQAARESAERKAAGDAQGAARATRMGELRARQVDLEKRRLDLQGRELKLETEFEKAERPGGTGKGVEALEKSRRALEAESENLQRQAEALEAEARVLEVRAAREELAKSLADQVASLRGELPAAAGQKAELEREAARLEAALEALNGSAATKAAGRSTPTAK
jgi:beta-lactamase regulating signal transducer with metallopeptidase domain